MNSVRNVFLVPVVALLVPALVACGGSSQKDKGSDAGSKSTTSASSSPSASDSPSDGATSSADGVVLHKDGFSVTLPSAAEPRTQSVPTKAGKLDVTLYLAPDATNGGTYVVAMTAYPANAALNLDNAIKGAATNVSGTVKASQKGTYEGHPSRDAVITATTGGQDVTVFSRFIQVDHKLFQLQYVLQKGGLDAPPAGFTDVVNSVKFD